MEYEAKTNSISDNAVIKNYLIHFQISASTVYNSVLAVEALYT